MVLSFPKLTLVMVTLSSPNPYLTSVAVFGIAAVLTSNPLISQMLSRFVQFKKAPFPIEVTVYGISMLSRLLQSRKAYSPMEGTRSGIIYEEPVFPQGYVIN